MQICTAVKLNNGKTDIILKFHPPHLETNQNHQLDQVSSDTKSFADKVSALFYVISNF